MAMTYAMAFVAWHDLSHLLTPAIRTAARRVYPPGAPSIRIGQLRATATVIEAVADELGIYVRNALYQDRATPFDPDYVAIHDRAPKGNWNERKAWIEDETKKERRALRERLGIKNLGDAWMLMVREWKGQDAARVGSRLKLLRCGSIDFYDLQTQLDREALAVIPPAVVAATTLPARDEPDETAGPALTPTQLLVLRTMARFDASVLLSAAKIVEGMDAKTRLSEETVRLCVVKLIDSHLAERPEGDRSGARLNTAGRRLARKIAD